MKQILKSIGFGVALGAAAFFIPFTLKLVLVILVIGFTLKVILSEERRPYFTNKYDNFDNQYAPVVPIDNQWYKPSIQQNDQEQHISINYESL